MLCSNDDRGSTPVGWKWSLPELGSQVMQKYARVTCHSFKKTFYFAVHNSVHGVCLVVSIKLNPWILTTWNFEPFIVALCIKNFCLGMDMSVCTKQHAMQHFIFFTVLGFLHPQHSSVMYFPCNWIKGQFQVILWIEPVHLKGLSSFSAL